MLKRAEQVLSLLAITLLFALVCYAQQPASAPSTTGEVLTNADVISMVKSGLPEAVIIGSIKTSENNFDISAKGLIALQKASVPQKVMQAMIDAVASKKNASPPPAGGAPSTGVTRAGDVVGGLLFKKSKPTFTYAWALPGATSSSSVPAAASFQVTYAGIPGVNPDDYEPHIVKLAPTKEQGWRLAGAAKATEELAQSTTPTWPVYSAFIEDTVSAQTKKTAPGDVTVTRDSPLAAGEYAVVLRPVARSKKFAGTDLTNGQGEGLIFNSALSFSVK